MAFTAKPFGLTLAAAAAVELLSLAAFYQPVIGTVVCLLLIAAALIASLRRLEYGLYFILAELFIGSQGHLLEAQFGGTNVSLRIGLFIAVLAAWLWHRLKAKNVTVPRSPLWYCYLGLGTFISIGLLQGLAANDFGSVFFDFNAWMYFGLTIAFFDAAGPKFLERTIQILLAATAWVAAKTVVVLLLFSHNLTAIGGPLYQWLRDTRTGEVTLVSGTIFRIFFQSQLYVLIGYFIVAALLIHGWQQLPKRNRWLGIGYLYLVGVALVVSQSRSFWVGAAAAAVTLLVLLVWRLKLSLQKTAQIGLLFGVSAASALLTVQLITGNVFSNIVGNRFKDLPREAAGMSRLNQLQPLTKNIAARPLLGYGFGKTLTYQSRDPRVLETHPDGRYTTYAFEWGYLDIALKIGVLGLGAYLVLVGYVVFKLIQNLKFKTSASLGLLAGLVALVITNVFSPYLNHPLGIGYVMLVSALIAQDKTRGISNDEF